MELVKQLKWRVRDGDRDPNASEVLGQGVEEDVFP